MCVSTILSNGESLYGLFQQRLYDSRMRCEHNLGDWHTQTRCRTEALCETLEQMPEIILAIHITISATVT